MSLPSHPIPLTDHWKVCNLMWNDTLHTHTIWWQDSKQTIIFKSTSLCTLLNSPTEKQVVNHQHPHIIEAHGSTPPYPSRFAELSTIRTISSSSNISGHILQPHPYPMKFHECTELNSEIALISSCSNEAPVNCENVKPGNHAWKSNGFIYLP